MKKLLPVLVLGFLIFQSCKKIPIGFLTTEYASYNPDSLVLKSVLDTNTIKVPNAIYELYLGFGFTPEQLEAMQIPPFVDEYSNKTDYLRYKNNIPWVTTGIQGLKGTAPIKIEVISILPATPESDKLKKLITIRGSSGIMEVPLDHGLLPGRYLISLRFSNEGWSKEMKDAFTFIIE